MARGGGGLDTHVCDEMMMRVSLGVCVVFVVVGGFGESVSSQICCWKIALSAEATMLMCF